MQFEALKVFCDVARQRSFSQAALVNDLTQSAVSQMIAQLEARLEVLLIDRSTRPLQLTGAGKKYYDGCKGLVEQYQELEASIRNAQRELETVVQIAAIYSVGLGDMGEFVARFQARRPKVKVQVEYLHPDRVYERVLDGTADFGLVSFPRKIRELTVLPWREEEMVLCCAPRHPLGQNLAIRPTVLGGQKYVGFDRGLVIRREVDRFLRENDVEVEVALEFDNVENIKQAVAIGAGVALLPEPTFRAEVRARTLVALPLLGAHFVRPLGVLHRRHHKLSATARQFIELLQADGSRNGNHAEQSQPAGHESPRKKSSHSSRNGAAGSPRGAIG
jgi:DNA-binding transcriptional LysR family regulator